MKNSARRGLVALLALGASALAMAPAMAQSGAPIKIGFSMAMTGGLGPNGSSALLAQKIWEEDVNAKGGLLGRPVELFFYDSQSNNQFNSQYATQALVRDKVQVIHGGITSSSREVAVNTWARRACTSASTSPATKKTASIDASSCHGSCSSWPLGLSFGPTVVIVRSP